MAVEKKGGRVGVSLSVTRNLGNYNSIKPEAWYEDDIRPDETPDEAFDRIWAVVEDEIGEKVQEALEA